MGQMLASGFRPEDMKKTPESLLIEYGGEVECVQRGMCKVLFRDCIPTHSHVYNLFRDGQKVKDAIKQLQRDSGYTNKLPILWAAPYHGKWIIPNNRRYYSMEQARNVEYIWVMPIFLDQIDTSSFTKKEFTRPPTVINVGSTAPWKGRSWKKQLEDCNEYFATLDQELNVPSTFLKYRRSHQFE